MVPIYIYIEYIRGEEVGSLRAVFFFFFFGEDDWQLQIEKESLATLLRHVTKGTWSVKLTTRIFIYYIYLSSIYILYTTMAYI